MTVSARFATLINWATPSSSEIRSFETHKASVASTLKSNLEVVAVDLMGSYARGSAVGGHSDIDLLAVLRTSEVKWGSSWKRSDAVMQTVRKALLARFPDTDAGRDGQAVVVQFAAGEDPVDVVPAFYIGAGPGNYPKYAIPDGAGGWMETSPQAHNRYIEFRSGGGKVPNVARIAKWWRLSRDVEIPLSGFHVEMLLANQELCSGVKSYAQCFADLLDLLDRRECAALQDPLGVSGYLRAAATTPKRKQLCATVAWSAERARAAVEAERNRDLSEAYRLWDLVFKGAFPKS
jgi:predicted nucleotidyltransferase